MVTQDVRLRSEIKKLQKLSIYYLYQNNALGYRDTEEKIEIAKSTLQNILD